MVSTVLQQKGRPRFLAHFMINTTDNALKIQYPCARRYDHDEHKIA